MNRDFPFGFMFMVSWVGLGDFLSDQRFGKLFCDPHRRFF